EDAGDVVQWLDRLRVVRLFPGFGAEPDNLRATGARKDVPIEVRRRVAEGGGGADDRDPRLVAAGKLDEARKDDPFAQLVLGAAFPTERSHARRTSCCPVSWKCCRSGSRCSSWTRRDSGSVTATRCSPGCWPSTECRRTGSWSVRLSTVRSTTPSSSSSGWYA